MKRDENERRAKSYQEKLNDYDVWHRSKDEIEQHEKRKLARGQTSKNITQKC